MRYFSYAIGLTALLMSPIIHAQTQTPIHSLYSQALTHSNTIKIQEAKVSQAKARLQQIKSQTNTQLSFQGSETIQDNSGVGTGAISPFTAQYKPEFKLAVTQPLFSGFRDQEIQASLQSEIVAQELELKNKKQSLFLQILTQYFDILRAQKDLETAAQTLQILNDRTGEISRRVSLGKARRNDLSSVQAESLDISATISDSHGQLAVKRVQLESLVDGPVPTFLQDIPLDLQALDIPEDHYSKIVLNRPEMTVLAAQIESQKHQLQAAKLTNMPTLDLAGNYYFQRTTSLDPIKWDASLRLIIPFLEGGLQDAKGEESTAILTQLEQQRDELEKRLLMTLRVAVIQVKTAIQVSKATEKAYLKAKETYAEFISDYQLGLANHLDVLRYLNSLMDMKRKRDVSAIQLQKSAIILRIETGGLAL